MTTNEAKLRELLRLAQDVLDEIPFAILVLSAHGRPLWFNREAAIVCSIWNGVALTKDALPLQRISFAVPPALWQECKALLALEAASAPHEPRSVSDPARGLYATVRLRPRKNRRGPPACLIQLDYRRPRSDRDRPLSPTALSLMSLLTFRQREIALRLREGHSTREIAEELRRSPLTVKTQVAAIMKKLGINHRAQIAALLNR